MVQERAIRFKKSGSIRFISHLDTLRLFQRAFRRTGLPLSFSRGFNPHPKIKVIPAIKLGVESKDLLAYVRFDKEAGDISDLLQKAMPNGIEILEVI